MNLLDDPTLQWQHFTGSPRFDYPIDYWGAVVDIRDDGHLDLVYRWEPNSYCHFHRHLCTTTSTVIRGELRVTSFDDSGNETGTRVRGVGDYSHTAEPDLHMECAGPDGALLLFNLHAPDGILIDVLAPDLTVLRTTTTDELREIWSR